MKLRNARAWVALAATLGGVLPSAIAAGTHTLSIGATILAAGNCRFETAGPTLLNFGAIDPSALSNAVATVDIPFRCNGGGAAPSITWSVTSDNGLHETGPGALRMRHTVDLARYLPYTLNIPASGSVPKNSIRNLTVTGTILVANFAQAAAGAYADSVVLSIAP